MIIPAIKDYPKELYVRGDRYRVLFVKNLENIGETDSGKLTIKLRAGMSKNETFRTLIHEILHAIEFSHPIDLKHKVVYELEEALFNLILDNFT